MSIQTFSLFPSVSQPQYLFPYPWKGELFKQFANEISEQVRQCFSNLMFIQIVWALVKKTHSALVGLEWPPRFCICNKLLLDTKLLVHEPYLG